MGINLKNRNWEDVIAKNKKEDKKRIERGLLTRFPEPEHFPMGNIKTSESAESWIQAHAKKYNQHGKQIVTTERGKRRVKKLRG